MVVCNSTITSGLTHIIVAVIIVLDGMHSPISTFKTNSGVTCSFRGIIPIIVPMRLHYYCDITSTCHKRTSPEKRGLSGRITEEASKIADV